MDPKENDSKWSKKPPAEKLEQLRRMRDVPHRLKSPDRLYNQDWFLGQVMDEGLEQAYMNEIAFSYRT